MPTSIADRKRALELLESLLDRGFSVANVLDMLSEVCGEKAEHVRSNWQDDDLADQWIRFASFLDEKASEATEL